MMIVPNITPQYKNFNTDRRVGFNANAARIMRPPERNSRHNQGGFIKTLFGSPESRARVRASHEGDKTLADKVSRGKTPTGTRILES